MIPRRITLKIFTIVSLTVLVAIVIPIILARTQELPTIWPILGTLLTVFISSVLLAPYFASKKSLRTPRSYPPKKYELTVESPLTVGVAFDRIEELFATRRDAAVQRQHQELKVSLGSDYKLRMYGVFSSSGRDALPITAIVRAQNTENGSQLEISCSDDLGWFMGSQGKQVMEVAEGKVRETAQQVANAVTKSTLP